MRLAQWLVVVISEVLKRLYKCKTFTDRQERPYHSDSTASRLLSEVKHCRARLVLRWGTTLESLVLFFLTFGVHGIVLFDILVFCNTMGDHVGTPGVFFLTFLSFLLSSIFPRR